MLVLTSSEAFAIGSEHWERCHSSSASHQWRHSLELRQPCSESSLSRRVASIASARLAPSSTLPRNRERKPAAQLCLRRSMRPDTSADYRARERDSTRPPRHYQGSTLWPCGDSVQPLSSYGGGYPWCPLLSKRERGPHCFLLDLHPAWSVRQRSAVR